MQTGTVSGLILPDLFLPFASFFNSNDFGRFGDHLVYVFVYVFVYVYVNIKTYMCAFFYLGRV